MLVTVMLVAAIQPLSAPPELSAHASNQSSHGVEVATVSARPGVVTGGDALVRIDLPGTVSPDEIGVSLEGRDVTGGFAPASDDPRTLLGRVDGLEVGRNILAVTREGEAVGDSRTTLELTNHPITGPVLSGPHQQPFICQTEAFSLASPVDEYCSAPTRVDYFYLSSDGGTFKPLDPNEARPDDVDQTTTTDGNTVDYIARLETGTINRAVYRIAFLHDPFDPGVPLPDPSTSTPGWNDRMVYSFGGGCQPGYRQGTAVGGVLRDDLLSHGFAAASSSLNVFGNNCNDVISAETVSMVKEYFIESFGVPAHTIGWGASGGSMQQHLIAQNYPGLLDGITPANSFPDITTMIPPVTDCTLILRAIDEGDHVYTPMQRSAVTGFANRANEDACTRWTNAPYSPEWITPTSCPGIIPEELRYDATSNPDGARCSLHDNTVNVFGTDPETGFARRPLDNVGVQYGLQALNDGVITFDQFAELNELVGGYDVDGNLVSRRTTADPEALRIAYETGRVNSGAGGLAEIPIIDVRIYRDLLANIHDRFRSFSTRERLIQHNGHADNHVIWITGQGGGQRGGQHRVEALLLVDEWLTAVANDSGDGSLAEKVVRHKPDDAVDTCWPPLGNAMRRAVPPPGIQEPATYDEPGVCNAMYPSHADPRLVAGAPVANDILKCQLKPVTQADYEDMLSDQELERLRDIFPSGVCDYSRPGVGQQPLQGTWLRY